MKTSPRFQPRTLLRGLGAVAILGAASCAHDVREDRVSHSDHGRTTTTQEEYVYYPSQNVYYNRRADNFRVYEGNHWVTQTTPRNLNRQEVLASESVSIAQYGTPERHYSEYVQPNLRSGSQSVGRVTTTSSGAIRTTVPSATTSVRVH